MYSPHSPVAMVLIFLYQARISGPVWVTHLDLPRGDYSNHYTRATYVFDKITDPTCSATDSQQHSPSYGSATIAPRASSTSYLRPRVVSPDRGKSPSPPQSPSLRTLSTFVRCMATMPRNTLSKRETGISSGYIDWGGEEEKRVHGSIPAKEAYGRKWCTFITDC